MTEDLIELNLSNPLIKLRVVALVIQNISLPMHHLHYKLIKKIPRKVRTPNQFDVTNNIDLLIVKLMMIIVDLNYYF